MAARYARKWRHICALIRYGTFSRVKNVILVEMERVMRRAELRGLPYIIVIDPINVCNLKCPFCPTGRGALPLPPGQMSLDNFKRIVDGISPHAVKLILYNWGEPFLHKDILSMIRYAHERRLATAISSNLTILPDGGGAAVVQSGLDDLVVSCDGLTRETYEMYRRGGNLERVLSNLREIAEAKRELKGRTPVIEFQFLVFRHNEHEIPKVAEFARNSGADFARLVNPYLDIDSQDIRPAQNPDFVRPQYLDQEKNQPAGSDIFSPDADQELCASLNPPPIPCCWPWRAMVINWNGKVDPCCGKNYRESFGNVLEQPLREIWNSPAYLDARNWITGRLEKEKRPNIVCRGCAGYQ